MPNLVSFRLMDFGFKPSPCQGDNRLLKVRLGSSQKKNSFLYVRSGNVYENKENSGI